MAHSCLTALARQRTNPNQRDKVNNPNKLFTLNVVPLGKLFLQESKDALIFFHKNLTLDLKKTAEIPL